MKDPMEITRLTTDNPKNNTETMLNYAYAKDKMVYLIYGNGQEDVDLCEYISVQAKEKHGCEVNPEDLLEGGCMECDCEIAILYTVAIQAAELRTRLKEYEDTGTTPEEIQASKNNNPLTIEELKEMSGKPYWHVVSTDFKQSPDHWRILPDHVAQNPEDYHYGDGWFAYRIEKK